MIGMRLYQAEATVTALYDLSHTIASPLLRDVTYPWEVFPKIRDFVLSLGLTLSEEVYNRVGEDVWIAKSAKISPLATIKGPVIIDEEAELRPGAFIRGSVIVGRGAVVGNSTELKNCILFDGVQVPHFNYVGDSVLGYKAHMGAGAVTSNVKSDKSLVVLHFADADLATGYKKFGACLGDGVEVGCNSVLNPGTVIGKESNVYPLSSVRNTVAAHTIYKGNGSIVQKH